MATRESLELPEGRLDSSQICKLYVRASVHLNRTGTATKVWRSRRSRESVALTQAPCRTRASTAGPSQTRGRNGRRIATLEGLVLRELETALRLCAQWLFDLANSCGIRENNSDIVRRDSMRDGVISSSARRITSHANADKHGIPERENPC